ncbi:serine--tRNA ligase [Paenibacillus campinasensis]|uniref:Serine--tRNA ligase n=1 Tax=Paenibacillus campinasensis TaxID=66347 RepID=A0A268EW50_9BACL|nr:serine--tRNA ligase [Paenibacillus campinasensis]PAD77350.1 serine--tRNA ligase [Paenibacillus campinasensis]
MLDMKSIRESEQYQRRVQLAADHKGIKLSVAELLDLDNDRRRRLQEVEQLRQRRNAGSQEISLLMQQGAKDQAELKKQEIKHINLVLGEQEQKLREVEARFNERLALVPNIVSPDTPVGASDQDNVEVRRIGEPAVYPFPMRDHVELGELHGMMDIGRGVKTAGSRGYYLKGAGVLLHRAVQQLALDRLMHKGFMLLDVPLMVRTAAMENTAFFPLGQDQAFAIADEDRWLVGTSEVPLVNFYSGEIVDVSEPLRLTAASLCFRSEVGSAGRDVSGLYRVHQFAKVEQVILCEADEEVSERLLQEITANAEELLQLLELPYRVVAVCTGDMSQKTYKQYDIETWMPSRQAYGETHSSSNLLDFQARRSNIRYLDSDGQLRYCHTLNNTAVASPRILIPLLENHQREDGSIYIPQALRPYMNGIKELTIQHHND